MCGVLSGKTELFDPTTVELLSKCRFDGAERTKKSVFVLIVWHSREGWLHGVKFLFGQG